MKRPGRSCEEVFPMNALFLPSRPLECQESFPLRRGRCQEGGLAMVSMYLIFNPHDATIRPRLEGKMLFWALPVLDDVARELGVRHLQSFMDNRPEPPGFESRQQPDIETDPDALWKWLDAAEEAEATLDAVEPWNEWFDPQEGVATTTALADQIASNRPLATEWS